MREGIIKEKEVNGHKKVATNEKGGRKDLQTERHTDKILIDRQETERTNPETGRQTDWPKEK